MAAEMTEPIKRLLASALGEDQSGFMPSNPQQQVSMGWHPLTRYASLPPEVVKRAILLLISTHDEELFAAVLECVQKHRADPMGTDILQALDDGLQRQLNINCAKVLATEAPERLAGTLLIMCEAVIPRYADPEHLRRIGVIFGRFGDATLNDIVVHSADEHEKYKERYQLILDTMRLTPRELIALQAAN